MGRRKYTHRYNFITGQNEKVLKPGYYRDPFSGQVRKSANSFSSGRYRRSRPLTRGEQKLLFLILVLGVVIYLLYELWVWMASHILISVIVGAALIGGIVLLIWKVPNIKNMLTSRIKIFGSIKDEEIKNLIDVIEGLKVQDVRNEEDFEKQLFQRLDAKGYQAQRQVSFGPGKRVDLVVGDRIGIELKVADRAKNVQDLIGQVTVYKNHLRKVIVVILDVGVVADLQEYIELIKNVDIEKISVVLIRGNIKRYQKREEYILVKKTTSQY